MIINKKIERKVTLFWIGFSFFAAHLLFLMLPNIFEVWNEQTIDRFLSLKSNSKHFRADYDETVVHIDLNNSSLHALNNYYLNRSHHAQVVRNLTAMNVSAQMYDFIFAGPRTNEEDNRLIEATQEAGNVYFGMVFRLVFPKDSQGIPTEKTRPANSLAGTQWQIKNPRGAAQFYVGKDPLTSFTRLAAASHRTGYLNIKPDRDGVFRRLPLLVRYNNGYYPSFSLRVVCDFLNVKDRNVSIEPGIIKLNGAQYPGKTQRKDVIIPVDKHGNMRINFVGPWDRMKHYNFSDVYFAGDDSDELTLWRKELSGKITLISDVSTGSTDVGQVPTDADFPLSGVHANSVHTILTGTFLKEPPGFIILFIEIALLLILAIISFQRSAIVFTMGSVGIAGSYIAIVIFFTISENLLLPIIRPLLMLFFSLISLYIASAVENARTHAETEKAREIAERDLEIGRKIQSGFFPKSLPAPSGWEIVAYFKPARQVAGDFYDVFKLGDCKFIGIVIADVCDKGVGAALFMALIRSLVRAFAIQSYESHCMLQPSENDCPDTVLLNTVHQANNYIAKTHEDDSMFATLFLGILNPESGLLSYVNCGHEPPVVVAPGTIKSRLQPTGPAIGMMPDLNFRVEKKQLEGRDLLFAFTDGLTDAENENDELFTRDRLLASVETSYGTAAELVDSIKTELFEHIAGASQFDDITMIAVRRH